MDHELFDPAQFSIDLASDGNPTRALKKALQHADGVLKARFEGQRDIHKLIHDRAWLTDQILCQAWITLACPLDAEIALLAAGGYGRCELHPHSDIDLLILLRDGSSGERYHESISRFLTLLWDIGLEVGHSVRSISECQHEARADVTVITNLMESRILIGEPQLRQDMIDALGPQYMWTSAEFFRAKRAEQHARHAKFNDTEYNLEPNVKGSPGGLRDIQTIGWVALRHFGTNDLRQLVDQGFLNESEYSILTNGRAFLWQVRFALHTLANRAEDRLLFDHQRALARLFGFEDNDAKLAVERFMQKYYRIVMSLSELNDLLMQHFEEILLRDAEAADIQPLNERFQIRNHYIEVTHPQVFKRTPFALLEIFLLMAQHQEIRGVRADTIRLLRDNRHLIDDDFRSDTRNTGLFMELLRCREGVHRNVRRMSRYGILGRYLPEFGRIVGQMQHDLFHIYTVDAHTLNLIKHLRKLEQPDYQEKYPLAWKIFCRLPKPDLLYIAGLYHDIAKGRGGDHSELGAIDANLFCQRHQLPAWDTHLVCWLVEHHLLMSTTAQRKDIADPEVIHDFAVQMDNQVRLDYLYVLTIADINATNPNLWNSWRASLLRQLYTETKRALRRGLDNPPNRAEQISDTQRAAMDILVRNGIDEEDTESLWTQLDDSYFLRHTASDIAWQTEAILQHPRHRGPLVLIKETAQREFEGATQIFLYTSEQHDLFAVTVAAMDQLNLSIQDARVIATNNINLGTYIVLDADGGPIGDNPERIREIKRELNEVLSDPEIHPSIIQRRVPRQLKHFAFAPEVTIFTDHGGQHTTLELSAPDRPGLLAKMGKIFLDFDISVQNARIVTLGERVDDVFVLTDADNQPLSDPQLCQRLQNTIIRTLSYNIEQPDQDTPQSMDI